MSVASEQSLTLPLGLPCRGHKKIQILSLSLYTQPYTHTHSHLHSPANPPTVPATHRPPITPHTLQIAEQTQSLTPSQNSSPCLARSSSPTPPWRTWLPISTFLPTTSYGRSNSECRPRRVLLDLLDYYREASESFAERASSPASQPCNDSTSSSAHFSGISSPVQLTAVWQTTWTSRGESRASRRVALFATGHNALTAWSDDQRVIDAVGTQKDSMLLH